MERNSSVWPVLPRFCPKSGELPGLSKKRVENEPSGFWYRRAWQSPAAPPLGLGPTAFQRAPLGPVTLQGQRQGNRPMRSAAGTRSQLLARLVSTNRSMLQV